MNDKARHQSPRLNLDQRLKNDNDGSTTSTNSSTTTIQPGSSDSELCRLMSSGRSLESLADDDNGEEWVPEVGESYEHMVVNRSTVQMNSPTELGDTSVDEEAEEFEDETEDYGLVIQKHFQQLYGLKTPYNHCLLDDEWCNQVLKQNANGSFSWLDLQPFNATAQEQHYPCFSQTTTETEMASLSSFLQVSNNQTNEWKYKSRQQLVESDKMSTDEEVTDTDRTSQLPKMTTDQSTDLILDTQTTSQMPTRMLQLHESDDDTKNAVTKENVFIKNFKTSGIESRTSLRVEINSQSAIDEWTATSDRPSQEDSAQFDSQESKWLDTDNCLEYRDGETEHKLTEDIPSGTTEDDIPDQVLPINEWPANNHPLNFLYLINELALMNDFVVTSNRLDTRQVTDNGRFMLQMARSDRCTIEEIDSNEDTERSTSFSPTAANKYVKNPINDVRVSEKKQNTPKSSPKQPEESEEDVSYSGVLSKATSRQSLSGQEDSTTSVQSQQVPGNKSVEIISNMLRNEHMKNSVSPTDETASNPRKTITEKTLRSRIPRWKSVGLASSCKSLRHSRTSINETTEGTLKQAKTEDMASGGESEAKLLSNTGTPCDKKKATHLLQLRDKAGHRKHETGPRNNKSENNISSTLLDGQQSESCCAPAQEHETDNLKLPPIRRERESDVLPPKSKGANETTQDLFEIHRQKTTGCLKNIHQQLRGHLLAKLAAIPARKQQTSSTVIRLPSLSLQSTPVHKKSHPLAIRRPYTPPNRNVLEARAQWPQFYTSHPTDMDRGLPRRMALRDLPSLKKVPGFSYGVYE